MDKKQLLLRISPALWDELNRMAEAEFRSLNSEIEFILTSAVRNKSDRNKLLAKEIAEELKKQRSEE